MVPQSLWWGYDLLIQHTIPFTVWGITVLHFPSCTILCANTFFPIFSRVVANFLHGFVGPLCNQTPSISVLRRCTALWLDSMSLRMESLTPSWMPRLNHSWPLMSVSSLERVSILHVPAWNVQWLIGSPHTLHVPLIHNNWLAYF